MAAKCVVTVYMDYECLNRIESSAAERKVSRGELIREALEAAFPPTVAAGPRKVPPAPDGVR